MANLSDPIMKTLKLAMKLKRVMLKKNLRKAKAVCPNCPDKFINGALSGPRDHIRFHCDCRKMQLME